MKKKIICLIAILSLSGSVISYAEEGIFTDIGTSYPLYDSVMYAYSKGIINGMGNNLFEPSGILTVAQAIKLSSCIHADFFGCDDPVTPSGENHWAIVYYEYAIAKDIIKDGDFSEADFDKPITKGNLFYIFANILPESEYPEINDVELAPQMPENDYVKKLFCAGIITGNEYGFEEEKTITREDAAVMVFRMTAHIRKNFILVE